MNDLGTTVPPAPTEAHAPSGASPANSSGGRAVAIGMLVASAACVLGSVGTWATAIGGLATVNGTDGDGVISLILALLTAVFAGLLLAAKGPERVWSALSVLSGAGILAVFAYDGRDVFGKQVDEGGGIFGNVDLLAPGWGLWLLGLGAAAMVVLSVIRLGIALSEDSTSIAPSSVSGQFLVYGLSALAVAAFIATAAGALPSSDALADNSAESTQSDLGSSGDGGDDSALSDPELEGDSSSTPVGEYKSVSKGETLKFPGEYSVKIKSVDTRKTISAEDGFSDPLKAKGKWVVVNMSVKNLSGEEVSFFADDMIQLLDSDGSVYTTSGGRGDDQIMYLANYLDSRDLQPKLWESGNVAFDVPKSADVTSAQVVETLEDFYDEDAPHSFIEFQAPAAD